ncbi:hypothetical protein TKK_0000437 [Trichogramma kaykai]
MSSSWQMCSTKEKPIQQGGKRKCTRSKNNKKRYRKRTDPIRQQKVRLLKRHHDQHLKRVKQTKKQVPAPLQGVNPIEFFQDLVTYKPTSATRVPLISSSTPEKENNTTSVAVRKETTPAELTCESYQGTYSTTTGRSIRSQERSLP